MLCRATRAEKTQLADLFTGGYLQRHQNVIITGATGGGKTYIACALSAQACRHSYSTRYWRLSRLVEHLHIARADGSYSKQLTQLARQHLLVIDEWGLKH